jgi:hypothetical protein
MSLSKGADGLTKKQHDFCIAFVETGNASEAYRRTYSCDRRNSQTIRTNAQRLLHTDAVAAKIASLQNEIDSAAVKKLSLSRELVIDNLMEIVERAMGRQLVKLRVYRKITDSFEDIEISQYNATAAIRALELLGKVDTIGLFVERHEVDRMSRFEAMSDEELDAHIDGLNEKLGLVKIEDLPKLGYVKVKERDHGR